jgi:type IV pilus assembly protein PilE
MLRSPRFRIARAARRPAGGFTLIEVVIAILIVGILTAIAVPQYTDFVMRSRITDATATMDDIRVRMEQYFQDNRRYDRAGSCGSLGGPTLTTANFQFTCVPVGAPAQSYNVTAQGLNSMSAFVYTLAVAPAGVTRATTGTYWGATSPTCWVVRKNGHCS